MSEINSTNTNKSLYTELPADISAKPNALYRFISNDAPNVALIFCEYSELNFVENVVNKRGIVAKRLNSHLEAEQIPALKDLIQNNNIQAIILTQNSSRNLEELKSDLIINYSLADITAETYQQRLGLLSEKGRIITLVTTRDFVAFMPLSKALGVNIEKISLPEEISTTTNSSSFLKTINQSKIQCNAKDIANAEELLKTFTDSANERENITKIVASVLKHLPTHATNNSTSSRSIDDELNFKSTRRESSVESNSEEVTTEKEQTSPQKEIKTVTFKVSQGIDQEMSFSAFCSLAEEFAGADARTISELSTSSDSLSLETTVENFRIILDNLNGIEHNGAELVIEALSELPRNFKRYQHRQDNADGSHTYLTGKDNRDRGGDRHRGGSRDSRDRRGGGGYGRNNRGGNGGGQRRGGGRNDRFSRGGGHHRDDRRGGGGGGYRGGNNNRSRYDNR